jgi:hypothetical protein
VRGALWATSIAWLRSSDCPRHVNAVGTHFRIIEKVGAHEDCHSAFGSPKFAQIAHWKYGEIDAEYLPFAQATKTV